jgi:transposase InsO family protein
MVLRNAIEQTVLAFPGYGYRRVTVALRREGWRVNLKRVLRIMRHESLLCQLKRRVTPTTDSAHSFTRYPNLISVTLGDTERRCGEVTQPLQSLLDG